MPEDLRLRTVTRAVIVSLAGFLALATVGVAVQLGKYLHGKSAGEVVSSIRTNLPELTAGGGRDKSEPTLVGMTIETTFLALKLWLRLLYSIFIPTTEQSWLMAKEGYFALQPSLLLSLRWFFFETSTRTKLALVGAVSSIAGLWVVEREIKRRRFKERLEARVREVRTAVETRYERIRAEVAQKSKTAATLLPHVIYLTLAITILAALRGAEIPLTRGFAAWGATVFIPIVASSRALFTLHDHHSAAMERVVRLDTVNEEDQQQGDDDDTSLLGRTGELVVNERTEESVEKLIEPLYRRISNFLGGPSSSTPGKRPRPPPPPPPSSSNSSSDPIETSPRGALEAVVYWLRYWSVFAVILLMEHLPISGHVLAAIPPWPEIRLILAIWLQLSVTRGAEVAFEVVVPLLERFGERLPRAERGAGEAARVAALGTNFAELAMGMLVSAGFLSKRTKNRLMSDRETARKLLISLAFAVSPSAVARVGAGVVALAFPSHNSAWLVTHWVHDAGRSEEGERTLAAKHALVAQLEYWVVYSLLALAQGPLSSGFGWWLPLFDQMNIAALLWLQLPVFAGAEILFARGLVVRDALNRKLNAEKERRRRERRDSVPTPSERIKGVQEAMMRAWGGDNVAQGEVTSRDEVTGHHDDDGSGVGPQPESAIAENSEESKGRSEEGGGEEYSVKARQSQDEQQQPSSEKSDDLDGDAVLVEKEDE